MSLTTTTLSRQLEELNLLKCSLLPGETLAFVPPSDSANRWTALLQAYPDNSEDDLQRAVNEHELEPARFHVKVEGIRIWFEVELQRAYDGGEVAFRSRDGDQRVSVSAKGADLGRVDQARWNAIIRESMDELQDSDFPVYELISALLLPRLHSEHANSASHSSPEPSTAQSPTTSVRYHALLTSHHLISPNKRRSLHQWSNELSLTGFAKVGHPGVIYCEGEQGHVEEFVANVKAMQWLALRVRFVEPLAEAGKLEDQGKRMSERRHWSEFEKVGEVVEEMRRLGREQYVVEMGIGSAGANPSTIR